MLLISFREELTPDFLHFVTCMEEEQGHFIWIMLVWLLYKNFLSLDSSEVSLLTKSKQTEARVKVVARGFVEICIALLLSQKKLSGVNSLLYSLTIYAIASLRSVFIEEFDIPAIVFALTYCLQNFLVNIVDFVLFRNKRVEWFGAELQTMFSF